MTRPEDAARKNIDDALTDAGWAVQDRREMNLDAARGVAVREFPLKRGHGFADYLLYVDGDAVGVIEAKEVGTTCSNACAVPRIRPSSRGRGVRPHAGVPRTRR